MSKITIRLLQSVFLALASVLPGIAQEQWTVFPVFSSGTPLVENAGNRIYFANSGLFSYDKDSRQQSSYENVLNGREVTMMRYNPQRNYLFIAYNDANIDLLYDDGRVLNLPQISISEYAPCTVTDVAFNSRDIYVSTTFGLVKFNESNGEVVESGIYGDYTSGLAVTSNRLVLHHINYFYSIELGRSISKLDNFSRHFFSSRPAEVRFLDDSHMLCRSAQKGEYAFRSYTVDLNDPTLYNGILKEATVSYEPIPAFMEADGQTYAQMGSDIYEFAADGTMTLRLRLPSDLSDDVKTMDGSSNNLWFLGPEGLANIELSDDGNGRTVLADRFKPDALFTLEAGFFAPSPDGKELYVHNYGRSAYKPFSSTEKSPLTATKINLRTGAMTDASPYPVEAVEEEVKGWQTEAGQYALSPSMIAVDPDAADTYYLATGNDGVYKISDGKVTGVFGYDNSPINPGWGPSVFGVHIDRGGNLWIVHYRGSTSSISVLPAAMRTRPVSEVKKTDWISVDGDGFTAASDVAILECKSSGMIFIVSHGERFQLLAYDTNNTPATLADDKCLLWTSMTDQDGKNWTPARRISLAEDRNGRVWFGTNEGIYQITSPRQAVNPTMKFQKLKIPRNDGTNEADYLAGNDFVYGIAVDNRNRKWLATENSGLVCTNENGNAIIQTYDPRNSPLLDNRVVSVWADPSSGQIYAGTLNGLLRFNPSVESAAETFDEIMAYPNPVRPDYYGPVYIKGLMDNSLVKIADSAGGVIAQGRAENGVFRWDGCDYSGKRVKTGVYYVFASQNSDGNSSGAVTKIMVVN